MILSLLLALAFQLGPEQQVPVSGNHSQHIIAGNVHAYTSSNTSYMWTEGSTPIKIYSGSFKSDHPAITADGWSACHVRYSGLGNSSTSGMVPILRLPQGNQAVVSNTSETAFDPVIQKMPDGSIWVAYTGSWGMHLYVSHMRLDGAWDVRDLLISNINTKSHHPDIGLARGLIVIVWEEHSGPNGPHIAMRSIKPNGSMTPISKLGGQQAYHPSLAIHKRGFIGVAWRQTNGQVRQSIAYPFGKTISSSVFAGNGKDVKLAWDHDDLEPAILAPNNTVTLRGITFAATEVGSWDGTYIAYNRGGNSYWR